MARGSIQQDLIVEAISKGFKEVQQDLQRVGQEARRSGEQAERGSKGIDKSALMWTELSSAINIAQLAYEKVGRVVVDFARDSLDAASSVEETASLIRTSLGPAADEFSASMGRIADATNRSRHELAEGASTIIAMSRSMGMAQEEAGRFAASLTQAGVDLGSFFNRDTESVFQDIQAALGGSSETMQKYGIDVRETTLKQMALAKGLDVTGATLDRTTRAWLIQQSIMEQAGDAMGDAERTIDSYENTMRGLEASITDIKVAFGIALIPAVKDAVDTIAPIIGHFADLIRVADGATAAVGELAKGMKEVGDPEVAEQIEKAVKQYSLLNALLNPDGYNKTRQALNKYAAQIVKATDSEEEWVSMLKAEGIQISDGNAVLIGNMVITMDELREARQELLKQEMIDQYTRENRALREGTTSQEESATATEENTAAMERQRPALEDLVNLTGDRRRMAQEAAIAQLEQARAEERVAETIAAGKQAAEEARDLTMSRIEATDRYNQTIASGFIPALDAAEDSELDFNQALLESLASLGAAPSVLNSAAFATGNYSAEQIEAAIQARVMAAEIEKTAERVANGDLTVTEATEHLRGFQEELAKDYKMTFNTEELAGAQGQVQRLIDLLNEASGTYEARVIISSQGTPIGPNAVPQVRQHGGPVWAGHQYIVGEAGPELFIPDAGGEIVSNRDLRAAAGRSVNANITNVFHSVLNSPREFERQQRRGLNKYSRDLLG